MSDIVTVRNYVECHRKGSIPDCYTAGRKADTSPVKMSLSPGAVGALSATIVVPLVLSLLRRVKAYSYPSVIDSTPSGLSTRYRKWDRVARLLLLPLMFALGFACWKASCAIEAVRASFLGQAPFVLTPIPVFFALPSFLTGILLASIPLRLILTRFLGVDGYQALVKYQNQRQKIYADKFFRHMVYALVPILLIATALALQTYAVVDTQHFVIHRYWALNERIYHWEDVRDVQVIRSFAAPNGSIKRDRPYVVIGMADGHELNFHNSLLEVPFAEQQDLAYFVSAQAHIHVRERDPFPIN